MTNRIEYFKTNLGGDYLYDQKQHCFHFNYGFHVFTLIIKDINTIRDPKLFVHTMKPDPEMHLDKPRPPLKTPMACLGLDGKETKIWNPEELMQLIADWIFSAINYLNTSIHTHGYRHGLPAFIEEVFSQRLIPINKANLRNITDEIWKDMHSLYTNSFAYKMSFDDFKKEMIPVVERMISLEKIH